MVELRGKAVAVGTRRVSGVTRRSGVISMVETERGEIELNFDCPSFMSQWTGKPSYRIGTVLGWAATRSRLGRRANRGKISETSITTAITWIALAYCPVL